MPGTITFKPLEANLNHDTDIIGKADPYCMFLVNGEKIKGQASKSGGKHPIWEDAVTIPASNQSTCLVEIKDKDILKDDKLGSFEIDLREIEMQGKLRKWYPIFNKNRPAGEILMEAVYSPQGGLSQGMGGVGAIGGMGAMGGLPQQTHIQTHGMPVQTLPMQPGMHSGMPFQSTNMHSQGMMGAPIQQTVQTTQHTVILDAAPMMTQAPMMNQAPLQNSGMIPGNMGLSDYAYTGQADSFAVQYAQEALIRGVDPLGTHLGHSVPIPHVGHTATNNLLAGQGMQQAMPGQQALGHHMPGSQMGGQQIPGQQFVSQQVMGHQLPGQIGQQLQGQNLPNQQNIL